MNHIENFMVYHYKSKWYEELANEANINSLLINRKCVGPISSNIASGLNSDPIS